MTQVSEQEKDVVLKKVMHRVENQHKMMTVIVAMVATTVAVVADNIFLRGDDYVINKSCFR